MQSVVVPVLPGGMKPDGCDLYLHPELMREMISREEGEVECKIRREM